MLKFMKNKFVTPLLVVGILAAFLSFKYRSHFRQSSDERRTIVLETVMKALATGHFSPRQVNDSFSTRIYHTVLTEFDYDKLFFTAAEVNVLNRYEFKIDDEIRMGSIEFFDSVDAMYLRRIAISEAYYNEILDKPFEFAGNEEINLNAEKEQYAATEADMHKRWEGRLKYRVLSKFVDLKNEQDKKKENKDSVNAVLKTDAELEKQAREDIKKSYQRWFKNIRKIKDDDRFTMFVNAITHSEDPHTDYFPPAEKKDFDQVMSGSFFGIGAQLRTENDKTMVAAIVTGSPSWKQGELKAGDEIMKVAQGTNPSVDISGYEINDVVKLIRGEKGTEVRLTVKKTDGSIKEVAIIRGVVQLEETFAKSAIINSKSGPLGYIFLPEFYADFNHTSGRRCAVDVEREVRKLKDQGVAGIIIDLRFNSGGSLSDVVDMAGTFIGRNPVVQVKSNHAAAYPLVSQGTDSALYNGPLSIIVSGGSASASEILAAAMQDFKRAVIVGSTTYGKGTVQKMLSLDEILDQLTRLQLQTDTTGVDGTTIGSIKMTMEKFYRVNGGSTQLKGVTPDIVLPDLNQYDDEDMGERKNKSALPWDEVPAVQYRRCASIPNMAQLQSQSRDRVRKSDIFSLISDNAEYIAKRKEDNIVSLNEVKYKKDQEKVNAMSKKLEALQKDAEKLIMGNLDADMEKINLDSASVAKNKEWLKRLSEDVYIGETVNIMTDLIKQNAKKH